MDSIDMIFAESQKVKEQLILPKVIISMIICVLGLLANLLVIGVILLLREYKKSTFHWYVLQLAIADAVFLLTIPFQATEDLNKQWIYEGWVCKAKESILFINYYASIMFLIVMSINRYIAVCHPFADSVQKLKRSKIVFVIIVCVWAIAIFLAIPTMMYSRPVGVYPTCTCQNRFPITNRRELCLQENKENEIARKACLNMPDVFVEQCVYVNFDDFSGGSGFPDIYSENYDAADTNMTNDYYVPYDYHNSTSNDTNNSPHHVKRYLFPECSYHGQPATWTAYLLFNFIVMFILPFTALVVFYGLIIIKLINMSSKKRRNSIRSKQTESRAEQDRRRVTIMCAALVGSFLICWLPFHSIHLAKLVGIIAQKPHICNILPVVGTLLAYINSALNPYLYTFLGTGIKQKWESLKAAPEIQSLSQIFFGKKSAKDQTAIYQNVKKSNQTAATSQVSRENPTAESNIQLNSISPIKSSVSKTSES